MSTKDNKVCSQLEIQQREQIKRLSLGQEDENPEMLFDEGCESLREEEKV